jgi:gamma-glutamyl phosphate reductase
VIQKSNDSARFLDVFCLGLGTAVAITNQKQCKSGSACGIEYIT